MLEKNHFILICSDSEDIAGKKHSAIEITKYRLKKKLWPIYSGTRNRRNIKNGDLCLFYIAGKLDSRQTFIAKAIVAGIKDWSMKKESVDHPDLLTNNPEQVIELRDVVLFDPIPVRPLLRDLSFIQMGGHSWGGAFQGGCKLISINDYRLISAHAIPSK